MPARSAFDRLTDEQQRDITAQLTRENWVSVDHFHEWVDGYLGGVSRSAAARRAKKERQQMHNMELAIKSAARYHEMFGMDKDVLASVNVGMVQVQLFQAIQRLNDKSMPDSEKMDTLVTLVSQVTRAAIADKKVKREEFEAAMRQIERDKQVAQELGNAAAQGKGIDANTVSSLHAQLVGATTPANLPPAAPPAAKKNAPKPAPKRAKKGA